MRVEIYWNLHKRCFSVRALEDPHKGRVFMHANKLMVRNPRFVVREAVRQRVLAEGRKNVHAFVRGDLEGWDTWVLPQPSIFVYSSLPFDSWLKSDCAYARFAWKRGVAVGYIQQKGPTFYNKATGAAVTEAEMAYMERDYNRPHIYAFDPCEMSAEEAPAYY